MRIGQPIGSRRAYFGAAIGGRTGLPGSDNLPADIKFGHTRFAEAQASKHNWALHGTITEEQGEIHVAQGKVIGGGSSINGSRCSAVSGGFRLLGGSRQRRMVV
jgi:hypothetical protein